MKLSAGGTRGKLGVGCLGLIVIFGVLAWIGGDHKGTEQRYATLGQPRQPKQPELTLAKYNNVLIGMNYEEVVTTLGMQGQEISHSEMAGTTTIMYMWEGRFGANMNAMFQNGKLISKAQFGLH